MIQFAVCMRKAGLFVEAIIEYVKLFAISRYENALETGNLTWDKK